MTDHRPTSVYFASAWRREEWMSSPTTPADLLDLKMLPAWANEPARPNDYANFEGEDARSDDGARRGPMHERDRPRRPGPSRDRKSRRPLSDRSREPRREENRQPREIAKPVAVTVRFVPHAPAFNNVIAQIKAGSVAYSVFALARLFLEKPERYGVQLTSAADATLYQLGENGAVATDRAILESGAFASARDDFYMVEVTQTEPLKGNFTNVARCRLSGTLLGPTNHHNYQPQLRTLYESRFSRRMSFADYQKQIEIVSDPAVVEQWKEQARNITTYTTKNGDPPTTFTTAAEAERHFRQNHLPGLLRAVNEVTIGGVLSRRLPDRALARTIEDAWSQEARSPTRMMQELSAGLRQAALNIFRHRRGMLFVSPIRARVFGHESAGVSASINAILEKVAATPGISRKQLSEQFAPDGAEPAEAERAKLALASDLRWLVSEGYVIEFNDGSLDLPRTKKPAAAAAEKPAPVSESEPAQAKNVIEAQQVEAGVVTRQTEREPAAPEEPEAIPAGNAPANDPNAAS